MTGTVVQLHGKKGTGGVEHEPIFSLLYAMIVYQAVTPNEDRLRRLREIFTKGMVIDHTRLSVLVPTEISGFIDEITAEEFGKAAFTLQLMYDGKTVQEAVQAINGEKD